MGVADYFPDYFDPQRGKDHLHSAKSGIPLISLALSTIATLCLARVNAT